MVMLLGGRLLADAAGAGGAFKAYPEGATDDLRSAGFHKLVYEWSEEGKLRTLPLCLYLPSGYGSDDRRWPMLTFMAGLGDRGPDPSIAMGVGVPLEIGRNAELRKWLPMIVLTPQCPSDRVWDSPGTSEMVLRLIRAAAKQFAVDESRLYVTGFSDGGKGSWVLAAEAPELFAVCAPIVSKEYEAEETAKKLAGSGMTCLVVSGLSDPKSEPASSRMVEELRKREVDVTYAPVPKAGHFIWTGFYGQREFYEWLLLHARGNKPPKSRPTGEDFLAMYASREEETVEDVIFVHRMQHELDQFEPYWFVDNCGRTGRTGLRAGCGGKRGVYVTLPLSAEVPCRIQTTRQLPRGRATELVLDVGHPPGQAWELVVRVNEMEQARKVINDQTAPQGWRDVKVDLRPWAGQEARLQLIQSAVGSGDATAWWAKVKLVEHPQ